MSSAQTLHGQVTNLRGNCYNAEKKYNDNWMEKSVGGRGVSAKE